MDPKRKLRDNETPNVGDVCQLFDGAFGTALVTYVHSDGSVELERPMASMHGHVPCGISLEVERIHRVNPRLVEFWTYRDEPDNRWRRPS